MRKITTQISLNQDMLDAIKALAERKGWSMAQVIRLALEEYLRKEETP